MKSVTPVPLQVLNSYLWLVATTLDRADVTLFHHCRKFQWTAWKRKDKGPDTSPPVRNTNQRGFVPRRLHLRTPWHTRPEPIFPVIQKSSEFLGMPEKSWMGVYFDVEMPKIRSQDLAGGQPCFPINSRTFKLLFSLLGSNYPNLNVWDEKYLKYKMISFWKLLYEGLPTFMHFQKKECAAYVLFIISSQLTLFSFQHARNVNQHFLGEKSHPWSSNSVSHTKAVSLEFWDWYLMGHTKYWISRIFINIQRAYSLYPEREANTPYYLYRRYQWVLALSILCHKLHDVQRPKLQVDISIHLYKSLQWLIQIWKII